MSLTNRKYSTSIDSLQEAINLILEKERDERILARVKELNELYQKFKSTYKSDDELKLTIEPVDEEERIIYHKKKRFFAMLQPLLGRIASGKIKDKDIGELTKRKKLYDEIGKVSGGVASRKFGVNVSDYMIYTGTGAKFVTMFWLSLSLSIAKAAALVGIIFPPILYAFIALKALFDTSSKIFLLKANHQHINKILSDQQDVYNILMSESTQILRAISAFLTFSFNVAALVAFAGVLFGAIFTFVPVWFLTAAAGCAFVAGAAAAGWISDVYVPAKRAEKLYKECQKKLAELDKKIEELKSKTDRKYDEKEFKREMDELRKEYKALKTERIKLKNDYLEKSENAKWGLRGVLAVALIACAPIPIVGHLIVIAGYLIFAAVGLRSAQVAVKKYLSKPKQEPTPDFIDLLPSPDTTTLTSDARARKKLAISEQELTRLPPIKAPIEFKSYSKTQGILDQKKPGVDKKTDESEKTSRQRHDVK